jgi:hypothetical protein
MQLVHCSEQGSQTLDEFYADIAANEPPYWHTGPAMLSLIKRLREIPDDRQVWGLTSHSRLCLLAQDEIFKNDVFRPWYVVFVAGSTNEYYVEYRMPESIAPWPNAYVRGEARSEDEAVEMILTAMERSGGWAKSA